MNRDEREAAREDTTGIDRALRSSVGRYRKKNSYYDTAAYKNLVTKAAHGDRDARAKLRKMGISLGT